jgi:hypothetical protein
MRRRDALWVGALAVAAACGPRGPSSSSHPAVESVSIYSWGIDEYHGHVSSSVHLENDGCYGHESTHPMFGPVWLRSCMEPDQAQKLLADVEKVWAEGGWTETSYEGPSKTHREVVYVTTVDGKTWIAPVDVPIEELTLLASTIEKSVLQHYDRSSPSPDEVGPLEFAMASIVIVHGGLRYQADVDTIGRWQCAVPHSFGADMSFIDDADVSSGSMSARDAEALFADLFDGVSFEPAESRSVDSTTIVLRNYPGDQGRELMPDAAAIVVERWRKRAAELSKGCVVPER